MRNAYPRILLLFCLALLLNSSMLLACTCFPRQTFCEMFNPQPNDENTRVYLATVIDYVDVEPQPGYFVPTMRVAISEVLYGPDDLISDTLILVGQDGVNCATSMPISYDEEIVFLAEYIFQEGEYFYEVGGAGTELSGCGPSYLNVVNDQVYGPIGGNLTSGVTLTNFIDSLEEMGDCALSVDVSEPELTAEDFKIYPNPTNSRVFVDMTRNSSLVTEVKVSLITTMGKTVYRQNFVDSERLVDIDVANLPSGIYFLRLTTDQGEITKCIVVN